ncbi:MAG: ThuA domain-containing protein [Flavobacteriales bacterium]|nr:ThuA domain-containing protein [Flavobacteriales bacterium]
MKKWILFALVASLCWGCNSQKKINLLVFTKTNGFRHSSIEPAIESFKKLGIENNFNTSFTEDSLDFNAEILKNFQVVVFLNTTGNILNGEQQKAFESYIESGGGYVGIHAGCDTEFNWPWYGKLVGRYFAGHPKQQEAGLETIDKNHPSTETLPTKFNRFDEWYNFIDKLPADVNVLVNLNESTYEGGTDNGPHPISWHHNVGEGRSFFTAMGHTEESYQEELFLSHILGGILWAGKVK